MARAVEEMEYAVDYNSVVVNDTVESCAEEIYDLIWQGPAEINPGFFTAKKQGAACAERPASALCAGCFLKEGRRFGPDSTDRGGQRRLSIYKRYSYLIPDPLAHRVQPGSMVLVPFGGGAAPMGVVQVLSMGPKRLVLTLAIRN